MGAPRQLAMARRSVPQLVGVGKKKTPWLRGDKVEIESAPFPDWLFSQLSSSARSDRLGHSRPSGPDRRSTGTGTGTGGTRHSHRGGNSGRFRHCLTSQQHPEESRAINLTTPIHSPARQPSSRLSPAEERQITSRWTASDQRGKQDPVVAKGSTVLSIIASVVWRWRWRWRRWRWRWRWRW